MFNIFFSKRKVKKSKKFIKGDNLSESIDFSDLKGQNFSISMVENGNSTMLIIQEASGKYDILLDSEQSFLLSLILNEYGKNKTIKQTIKTLKEEE